MEFNIPAQRYTNYDNFKCLHKSPTFESVSINTCESGKALYSVFYMVNSGQDKGL